MKYRDITLSEIRRLPELQPRVSLSMDRVEQYAAAYRDGDEFPHLILYEIDGALYLTRGWHRLAGAEAAGRETHLCEVRLGSMADAEWDAATSNKDGDKSTLYRSNADKARAVQLALHARPSATDSDIARCVGVSHPTVAKYRPLENLSSGTERTDKNGRTINTAKTGKTPRAKSAYTPAPEPCGASKGGEEAVVWLEAEDFAIVDPLKASEAPGDALPDSEPHEYPAIKQSLLDAWADSGVTKRQFITLAYCAMDEINEEYQD